MTLAGLLEDNAAAYLGELIAVLTHAGAMPLSPRRLRACLRRCQGEEEIQVKLLQAANTMWCLQGTEGLVPEEGVKDVALFFLEAQTSLSFFSHHPRPCRHIRTAPTHTHTPPCLRYAIHHVINSRIPEA